MYRQSWKQIFLFIPIFSPLSELKEKIGGNGKWNQCKKRASIRVGGGVIGSENKWEVSRTDGNDMKQHGSRLPVPLNSNGM